MLTTGAFCDERKAARCCCMSVVIVGTPLAHQIHVAIRDNVLVVGHTHTHMPNFSVRLTMTLSTGSNLFVPRKPEWLNELELLLGWKEIN